MEETDDLDKLWNGVVEIPTSTIEEVIGFKKSNRTKEEGAETQGISNRRQSVKIKYRVVYIKKLKERMKEGKETRLTI